MGKLNSTNISLYIISISLIVSIKKHPFLGNFPHFIMLYNDKYEEKGENDSFLRVNIAKSLFRNKILSNGRVRV